MNPDLSCLEIQKEVGTFVLFPYRQFMTLENDGAVFVRCFVQVVYSERVLVATIPMRNPIVAERKVSSRGFMKKVLRGKLT